MLLEGVELVAESADRHDFLFEGLVHLDDIHIVVVLDVLLDKHFRSTS